MCVRERANKKIQFKKQTNKCVQPLFWQKHCALPKNGLTLTFDSKMIALKTILPYLQHCRLTLQFYIITSPQNRILYLKFLKIIRENCNLISETDFHGKICDAMQTLWQNIHRLPVCTTIWVSLIANHLKVILVVYICLNAEQNES